jgi:hypothetical protein
MITAGLLAAGSLLAPPAVAEAAGPAASVLRVRPARIAALTYGDAPTITGSAWWDDDGDLAPVAGGSITLEAKDRRTGWAPVASTSTSSGGRFTVRPVLEPGRWSLRVVLAPDGPRAGTTASAGAVQIRAAGTRVSLTGPARVGSEQPFTVTAALTSPTAPGPALAGRTLQLQLRGVTTGHRWSTIRQLPTDAGGRTGIRLALWKGGQLRVVFGGDDRLQPVDGAERALATVPTRPVVPVPAGAPEPKLRFPQRSAPAGGGAAPAISTVPDGIWASMQGVSWRAGCPARSSLRLLQVNHWGFDGYRYRGRLIVRSDVANAFAAAFTDLYDRRYPIRQMVLPDVFGRQWNGFGANDLASMAADNTSAFNCRYVDGKEAQRVLSPHAGGRALDLNPWENPYRSVVGPLPNGWYLSHRPAGHAPLLTAGSRQVTAFTSRGWSWGGFWSSGRDYQHFER